ncbi:hypothetical protein B0H13DRAFT_2269197 [Mycena leptocephala]|nr:hypothetical protein B0H13DRAFT_2269197 [Mycena leptocephala]
MSELQVLENQLQVLDNGVLTFIIHDETSGMMMAVLLVIPSPLQDIFVNEADRMSICRAITSQFRRSFASAIHPAGRQATLRSMNFRTTEEINIMYSTLFCDKLPRTFPNGTCVAVHFFPSLRTMPFTIRLDTRALLEGFFKFLIVDDNMAIWISITVTPEIAVRTEIGGMVTTALTRMQVARFVLEIAFAPRLGDGLNDPPPEVFFTPLEAQVFIPVVAPSWCGIQRESVIRCEDVEHSRWQNNGTVTPPHSGGGRCFAVTITGDRGDEKQRHTIAQPHSSGRRREGDVDGDHSHTAAAGGGRATFDGDVRVTFAVTITGDRGDEKQRHTITPPPAAAGGGRATLMAMCGDVAGDDHGRSDRCGQSVIYDTATESGLVDARARTLRLLFFFLRKKKLTLLDPDPDTASGPVGP